LALVREHIGDRELTEWYPEWMYELMETDEVRNQCYEEAITEGVRGRTVLELGTGRNAFWAVRCALAGAKKVYAIKANPRAYQSSLEFVRAQGIENVR
jgi:protein arginine N-methyltransferase 1